MGEGLVIVSCLGQRAARTLARGPGARNGGEESRQNRLMPLAWQVLM
jgi:hypothetical protein